MAELKKTMGFWMIAAIAFLNLVNTGMFFGVVIGAQQSGVDSLIAWGILAALSIYIATCFGELTSMFPSAGGVYEFAKQGYGRFVSFLIGWTLWVAGNIATALFTVAAINALPDSVIPASGFFIGTLFVSAAIAKMMLAVTIILLLNYIAYRGAEASARIMILLSIFMVGVMLAVIVPGSTEIEIANLSGFALQWSGIMLAVFFLSETFFGWESASYMSEETEDAARVVPRALVAVSAFVALMMLGIAIVTIGVLGTGRVIASDTNIMLAVLQHIEAIPILITIVTVGIVVAILGNASGNTVSLPRLLLAMSRDKLFIEQFADIHPRRQTPHKAIIFQAIVSIIIVLIAFAGPNAKGGGMYAQLLGLLVPVSLTLYAAIIILVPYFRWRLPDKERKFRAPLGSVLPVFVAGFFVALLILWTMGDPAAISQLRLLGSFVFFSVPIYLLLSYFYDPDKLIGTLSFFSQINLLLENFLLPRRIRHEILSMLHNANGKHVLEFGSGVGTLTLHLAEHVGSEGKIYAVGLSEADRNILERRVKKNGHLHVEAIHDPHLVNRVHPSIKYADIVISINHLSYIQDVKKVLREIGDIMPRRGQIYFVEYIDMFHILPNPKWLSNIDTVREVFAEAGFVVNVKVRHGIFWNYLHISGIKERKDIPYI